jgi:hypothetical protein
MLVVGRSLIDLSLERTSAYDLSIIAQQHRIASG